MGVGFGEQLARKLDLAFCDAAGFKRLKTRAGGKKEHQAATRQGSRDACHKEGEADTKCQNRDYDRSRSASRQPVQPRRPSHSVPAIQL
jgi:hypothetical protein